MQRRRDSKVETSYTGVGAFSSSPAPSTNALMAASVIGNALKANNNNPVGLSIPKVQPPRANKFVRAASITNDSSRRNSLRSNSNLPDNYISISRANSINTANARRTSLTGPKSKYLSGQKSTPNLKSRRSVSEFANSTYKPVPKTIKRYVPSPTGLVAVEVPNPAYNEELAQQYQKQQQQKQQQMKNRRSVSISNLPPPSKRSLQQQQQSISSRNSITNGQISPPKRTRSISKNIRRETKILPNGTKVVSTTVEEYINDDSDDAYDEAFDDAYDGFDDDHNDTVNGPSDIGGKLEEEEYIQYTEPTNEKHIYKNRAQFSPPTNPVLDEFDQHNHSEVIDDVILEENESVQSKDVHSIVNENDRNVSVLQHVENGEDELNQETDELENDRKYENDVKDIIAKNEELERSQREEAFESIDKPIEDSVAMEDMLSRNLATDLVTSSNTPIIGTPPHISNDIKPVDLSSSELVNEQQIQKKAEGIDTDEIDEIDEFDQLSDSELQPAAEQRDTTVLTKSVEQMSEIDEEEEEEEIDEDEDQDQGDYINDIDEETDAIENFSNRDLTIPSEEAYTEEEMLAAQRKLDELVKQKEKEILNDLLKNGDIKNEDVDLQGNMNVQDHTADIKSDNSSVYSNLSNEQIKNENYNNSVISNNQAEQGVKAVDNVEATEKVALLNSQPEVIPEKELKLNKEEASNFEEQDGKLVTESNSIQPSPSKSTMSKELTAVTTEQSQVSDAELVFHTNSTPLSKEETSNSEPDILPSIPQEFNNDDFYTPPITPIVPDSNRNSYLSDPADTLQPSIKSFRRSESPESAMLRTEDGVPITPTDTTRSTGKSMAQHLRPIFGSASRPSVSPRKLDTRVSVANPQFIASSIKANDNNNNNGSPKAVLNLANDFNTNDDEIDTIGLEHLKVPKREASIQAKIDEAAKRKSMLESGGDSGDDIVDQLEEPSKPTVEQVVSSGSNETAPRSELSGKTGQSDTNSSNKITRKKSVLKNSNSSTNNRASLYVSNSQSGASGAYISLATAQNTKLNASGGSIYNNASSTTSLPRPTLDPNANRIRSRSGSATTNINARPLSSSASGNISTNNMNNNNKGKNTPLAAAAMAAQRHSVQPGKLNYGKSNTFDNSNKRAVNNRNSTAGYTLKELDSVNVGGVKAPNPKVEEAKKRILQNRPGRQRAKELYELSKTRPRVDENQLVALDDSEVRRSSFEKDATEANNIANRKSRMASMSLRDISGMNYENFERYENKKNLNRGFKSRFQDDNSETDLPLPPLQPQQQPINVSSYNTPAAAATTTTTSMPTASRVPESTVPDKQGTDMGKSGFKLKFGLNKKKSKAGINGNASFESPQKSSGFTKMHMHSLSHSQQPQNVQSTPTESRFEKFFTEPHGPRRNVSAPPLPSSNVVINKEEGKKKKGFFKKMFSDH